MNLLFRGLASRLLLSKRKVKEEPPAVISVTESLHLTDADSGNTYSLDGANARIYIPLRAILTTGWNIAIQATVIGKCAVVGPADYGAVNFGGEPCDGISMDSLDARATITFNGVSFDAVAIAGTVEGYLD